MSWRRILVQIFDVVLRVPPLFVMDIVLNGTSLISWLQDEIPIFGFSLFTYVATGVFCFLFSAVVFMLPTRQILDVYSALFACVVLWFSYWFNTNYMTYELTGNDPTLGIFSQSYRHYDMLAVNIFVQLCMAFCYNSFRLDMPGSLADSLMIRVLRKLRGGVYLCLLQPCFWRMLGVPYHVLEHLPLTCSSIVGTELAVSLLSQIPTIWAWCLDAYITAKTVMQNYGPQMFLETQWQRLHVPSVLRVFWVARMVNHATHLIVYRMVASSDDGASMRNTTGPQDVIVDISSELLISGCETLVALLGMTSVVSYITHYFGVLMARFVGSDNDEDKNMGTVSAILFFILALQTGLTGLDREKRLIRLYRNFCLLSTAILHFIHSMINPLLMNLSASRNRSLQRHVRPLLMCFCLLTFPLWFLYFQWCRHPVSTWLLSVTAFSVEVIIKVVITLLLYTLFMVDAYQDAFWEKLDDYVYYIKSTGNTIEFLFGIFLFGNGGWMMLFESSGTIRALMLCIHAYFNIWVQAKDGWKVFMKRRTAVNKINSLPIANTEQIHAHNDVCAICYQELKTARITRCNHLFHGVCLRKWLYVQDSCPLCHELIYKAEAIENSASPNNDPPDLQLNGQALNVDQ